MRVRARVQDSNGGSGSSQEENGTKNNKNDGPDWQKVGNNKASLLVSVGEVVVSGRHVVKASSELHLVDSTIKVFLGMVQLHAILLVLFSRVFIVSVLSQKGFETLAFIGVTDWLIQHSHSLSGISIREKGTVVLQPLVRDWVALGETSNLNNVGSVGLGSSFSSISSGVLVASSPLEVNVVVSVNVQIIGNKVVFSGGIGLDDVSSLSTHVQVVNLGTVGNRIRSLLDQKDVRSILEGSAKLAGINSQLMGLVVLFLDFVLLDRGEKSILGRISEVSSWGVINSIQSGDVVSESQNTSGTIHIRFGKGPVVGVVVSKIISTISKVVFSVLRSSDAFRGSNSVAGNGDPFVSGSFTSSLVVLGSKTRVTFGDGGEFAKVLGFYILRFLLVGIAMGFGVGQNGNISP